LETLAKLIKHYAQVIPNKPLILNDIAIIYKDSVNSRQLQEIKTVIDGHGMPYKEYQSLENEEYERNAVTIMKATQCKGQQFTHVFMPFCTHNVWPGKSEWNLARRQFYTAMTRAENTLHMLYYEQTEMELGKTNISGRVSYAVKKSEFLEEMNRPELVIEIRQA
jgi:superfamily I DNA/RNA helicase